MKTFLLSLLLLLFSFAVTAQPAETASIAEKKLYIGASLNTVSYMMGYKHGRVSGSIEPVITLHAGYQLTRRLSVQIGAGYDKDKENFAQEGYEYEGDTELTRWNQYNTAKGLATPVSFYFTPFNPNRKLQLYATASIVPVFGSVKLKHIKSKGGATDILFEDDASGMNLFFTAGLMLKYKINDRLEGYLEGNLIYKDLLQRNNYADSNPKSIGAGLNYKLQ